MEELHVVNKINHASSWFATKQPVLLSYIVNLSSAAIIIAMGFFIGQIIASGIQKILLTRKIDNTISGFVSTLVRYIIIMFTFIAALGRMGVQTNSIIAILGAAGMAIGLALQGSLSNFAAGVLLVILRPLKTGEYVNLGNAAGTVQHVHIFHTMLKTFDGKIIVIPNGKIIAGNIVNYSREPMRRNQFTISVAYDSDVDLVISVLTSILKNDERVLKKPKYVVGLSEFTPSSLNFIVKCWSSTKELNTVYWDLMLKFKKTLDQNNILIPCPQMDVYLHKKTNKISKNNSKKIQKNKIYKI